MLGPVKFNATRDPGAGQSHQRRFDDMIVVDKIIAVGLVISPLDPASQLRQHHYFQIIVLQKKRCILLIHFLIADLLDHRVGIYPSRASLIDTFLQKHRILIRLSCFVCGNDHFFFPDLNLIHGFLLLSPGSFHSAARYNFNLAPVCSTLLPLIPPPVQNSLPTDMYKLPPAVPSPPDTADSYAIPWWIAILFPSGIETLSSVP